MHWRSGLAAGCSELERLETRRLLTTASVNSTHVLNIAGTSGDNVIVVNKLSNGKVSVSGVAAHFTPGAGNGQFTKIKILVSGGNDKVNINNNVPYNSATIQGGTGNDSLVGGKGNDSIAGDAGNDTCDGQAGADKLIGGADFDIANYSYRADNLTISLDGLANDGGNHGAEHDNVQTEEVIAGSGNDVLTGSSGEDFLAGGAGADQIDGKGGNDDVTGSTGSDLLLGSQGDDFIQAKNQDIDSVSGGVNDDNSPDFDLASVDPVDVAALPSNQFRIEGFATDADLNPAAPSALMQPHLVNLTAWSRLYVLAQPSDKGVVQINLGDNADDVKFKTITDASGEQVLAVNINGVVLYYNQKSVARLQINAGGGNDTVEGNSGIHIDMIIDGGEGNDVLTAGGREDIVLGGNGNDLIRGGNRSDILLGGAGKDTAFGDEGNDILIGGEGEDHLYGERGEDILIGGTTSYDNQEASLRAMLDEWRSLDSNADRIDHLRNGTGINKNVILSTGANRTVFDDNAADYLSGGYHRDWFFKHSTAVADTTQQGLPDEEFDAV